MIQFLAFGAALIVMLALPAMIVGRFTRWIVRRVWSKK